ncbi:MAG: ketoacyl-ACP synthase III, partial [Leptospiraceae bacterium]|nr:ketoacyl-ACP synthase III [Leptospiraceae bacterium]
EMGARAAQKALSMAGVQPDEIDFVLCATNSPADTFPSTAAMIQKQLAARHATAMDLQAGCTGWLYGMRLATGLIGSGEARQVLVVGTEALTRSLNLNDRSSVLFGDAGAAAVLSAGDTLPADRQPDRLSRPLFASLTTPSRAMQQPTIYSEELNRVEDYIQGKDMSMVPRPQASMDGKASLKLALTDTLRVVDEVLERAAAQGIARSDIKVFVPHQTNVHIVRKFCAHIDFPFERIPYSLDRYGGLSTAGIPTNLVEHWQAGRVHPGDLVLACGYGAGFTTAAMLLEWCLPPDA